MIKIVSYNGYIDDTSYISFTIEGGDSSYYFGDQIWCDETELEIYDGVEEDVLGEFLENVERQSHKVLKGYLRRMGVI